VIYLDNAATTYPKPYSVRLAVDDCLKNFSANPGRGGHELSLKASEKVYLCRKKIAKFFGCEREENVIFTPNCTTSINMVLKGVLNRGDHVICSALEHNAVLRPLNKLSKMGVQVDVARVFPGDFMATVNSFEALIKHNTKLIICTHASNVFGAILPISRIGEICKIHGILFCVDAAQTAGVLDINMKNMGIDFLCVAPHKGLYAPMGTGLLLMKSGIENTIIEGGTGSFSRLMEQPSMLPDKFESGTVNLSGIMGISAGIDFVNSHRRIYQSELRKIQKCYDAFKKSDGIELYNERPEENLFAPVLSFNFKGVPSEEAGAKLNDFGIATRPGLHCAPLAHRFLGTEEKVL